MSERVHKRRTTRASVLAKLTSLANADNVAGMARYGINPKNTLGVSVPLLRAMGKEIGRDHALALELWKSGVHEARILAGLIDDPALASEAQLERWARDLDSWDVCDLVCSNLFDRTPFAHAKAIAWSSREEEFVKRAGFVLMAALAVHDKEASASSFRKFLPIIEREALDERNFVKKAVNWALREIGKRSPELNSAAIAAARKIQSIDSKSARWIASDALRELESSAVQERLKQPHGR
jgi:3-methyladenine DNA glycosylase AlkD